MFSFRQKTKIATSRLILRPPMHFDFKKWKEVRYLSKDFLTPWEPKWASDHLTRKSFSNRVYWSSGQLTKELGCHYFSLIMLRINYMELLLLIIFDVAQLKVEPWDTGLAKNFLVVGT